MRSIKKAKRSISCSSRNGIRKQPRASWPRRSAIKVFQRKSPSTREGANTAAIEGYNTEGNPEIELRQIKYLNNIVEQDNRAVLRIIRPMLGFKSFRSAKNIVAGIELMHMIRKDRPLLYFFHPSSHQIPARLWRFARAFYIFSYPNGGLWKIHS